MKPFIKIFIQKDEKNNFKGKEIFSNENIYLLEGNYIVTIYFKNLIRPVKENTTKVDVVFSIPNYRIEQIESIEPYIIKDEYEPNRHNIVFKEMIYACDKVFSSLSIELKQKGNEIVEENSQNENSGKNSEISNTKLNDKIKLILLAYQLGDSEDKNIDVVDKKFAHGLHGIKIHEYEFFNKLVIPNMTFEGGLLPNEGKKGGARKSLAMPDPVHEQQFHPYLLICYLDDCFDIKNSIAINKLDWNIKVFPSDKLCFIKDMSKEDQEKLLKNDWEEQEPGRAEKAKISRKRFMLEKIKKHGLKMKLIDVEYQFDGSKVIFYFTADGRIDFRELVKDLASVFRTRIELRQIGVRDEIKRIGGYGVCGKELCCCSYLGNFETVSIKMAKEQNLSLNPTKISGNCGRLMCCLKFEEDVYLEKLQHLPGVGSIVKTEEGTGEVVNLETLKENVKVKYHDEKEDSFYFKTHNVSELEIIKRVYPDEQVNLSAEEMKELQNMEKADKQDDSNGNDDI